MKNISGSDESRDYLNVIVKNILLCTPCNSFSWTLLMVGAILDVEANMLDLERWMLSTCHRFAGRYAKAKPFVMNQGLFVPQKVEKM